MELPGYTKERSQRAAGRELYTQRQKERRSQVFEEKLIIQRKSKSYDVIEIQSIFENMPSGEATDVCSRKKIWWFF